MPRAKRFSDRWGVNELNSVTNSPFGFDRYPTDPIAIGAGVHNGKVTVYRLSIGKHDVKEWTYAKDGIRVLTAADTAAHSAYSLSSHLQVAANHTQGNRGAY